MRGMQGFLRGSLRCECGRKSGYTTFKAIKICRRRFPNHLCHANHDNHEQQCRLAAERAVDAFVESNTTIGISHGKMGIFVLEKLADRIQQGLLQNVDCVTSSEIASVEAAVHGIPLRDLQDPKSEVSMSFVEADELDHSGKSIQFITGRVELASDGESFQQPQLTRLRKLLQKSSGVIALVSQEEKVSTRLGGSLPVVISSEEWENTAEELDDLFIGDAEIWRRSREQGANPRGGNHPYMTPEGHSIVDIRFISALKLNGENVPYQEIADEISKVPGVKTHGLILDIAKAAVFTRGNEAKIIEKGLVLGFTPDGQ